MKLALLFILQLTLVSSFHLVLMARRGKGNLKKRIEGTDSSSKSGGKGKNLNSLNQGRGQEITGVSLPAEGALESIVILRTLVERLRFSVVRKLIQLHG